MKLKAVEDANPSPYNTYKVQIAKALVKRQYLHANEWK